MKIGIMLRHLDQHGGGVKNYTNYLLDELLSLNLSHEFVLIYNSKKNIGTYSQYKNVREVAVNIGNRFLWDQIGVPWIQRKEKFDIIFNPKYSLPLLASCPTVFVCHGLDWYLMPWGSKKIDILNYKYLFTRYAAKAASIIAVSDTAKNHLIEFLNVEEERVNTVYLGIHESYRQNVEPSELTRIKKEYNLPEKYFLYAGQIYPPKNFGRLLQAYARVGPKLGIHLVVAGEHRWLCDEELKMIDGLGISQWVVRPGWIDNKTLQYFYKTAQALLLPSLYESFGLPILEAMVSGCPVLTSNRFGTKELAEGAAVLVDPENIDSISEGIEEIAVNKALRAELINKGYIRASKFSWKKCARETLEVLEKAVKLPARKYSHSKIAKSQIKDINDHLIIKQQK